VHRDWAARTFEDEVGAAVLKRHAAGGDRPAAESDRRVPAHGAEAGVVHEQRAELGGWGGRHHECAVHLGVSAGLQHEAAAVKVEPGRRVVALVEDGGPVGLGEALHDQAHRFAAGVHLDGAIGGDRVRGEIGNGVGVAGQSSRGFVDNAPGLAIEARFRAEGCPRG
jgi:hypothetical protein